jgi:hypothetical protein
LAWLRAEDIRRFLKTWRYHHGRGGLSGHLKRQRDPRGPNPGGPCACGDAASRGGSGTTG